MALKEECCFKGVGEIFLKKCLTDEEIAANGPAEFVSVGNSENFTVTSEVETLEKKNYMSKCGGLECVVSTISSVQVNLTLCCYKDLNMSLALAADCIEVPEVAEVPEVPPGPATHTVQWAEGDSLTFDLPGGIDCSQAWSVNINGQGADEFFTCDIATNTITYTGNLFPNGPLGETAIGNPGFTDGVDFTYISLGTAAVPAQPASKKFNMFSCTQDVYELEFRGCNAAKGADNTWVTNLYKVCFEPASEFQFITEDLGTIELVGRLLPDRDRVISDGTTDFPSEYGSVCIIDGVA